MAIINPSGLFKGERINRCSKPARLYYPWLLCASNTCGRIEVNYEWLVHRAFNSWPNCDIPSRAELLSYIREYGKQYLLFIYRIDGKVWGQWDTNKCTFGKYKTTEDQNSGRLPQEDFDKWIAAYQNRKRPIAEVIDPSLIQVDSNQIPIKFQGDSSGIQESFSSNGHGVGVGVPIGDRDLVLGENTSAHSRSQDTDTFNQSYKAYPRHVAKRASELAYYKAILRLRDKKEIDGDRGEFIYQRVLTYSAVCQRIKKPKNFIPHFSTWLNQDRFLDDPTEWAVKEDKGDESTVSSAERKSNRIQTKTRRVANPMGNASGNHAASLSDGTLGRGVDTVEGDAKILLDSGDRGGKQGINPQSAKTGIT